MSEAASFTAYHHHYLQQWFLQQIVSHDHNHFQEVDRYLQGSKQLPAQQGLAIYQSGYRLRLLECLQAEFPALQVYLGDKLFRLFAIGYLDTHTSQHYSLYELGANFSQFLATTRPPPASEKQHTWNYLLLPEQLASVERARANALRAQGCESLDSRSTSPLQSHMLSTTPTAVATLLSWPHLALPLTSQLICVDFQLLPYIEQVDQYLQLPAGDAHQHNKPNRPEIGSQNLLVFRHRYQIRLCELEPWQACIIKTLQETGHIKTADAWQNLAKIAGLSESELLTQLNLWLPHAVANSQLQHIS